MEPVKCNQVIDPEQYKDCYCEPNFTKQVEPDGTPECVSNSGSSNTDRRTFYDTPELIAAVAVPWATIGALVLGTIGYMIYDSRRNRIAPAPAPAIPAPNALNARTYASANAMRRMARIESFMPAEQRGPFYRAVDAFRRNDLTIRTAPF